MSFAFVLYVLVSLFAECVFFMVYLCVRTFVVQSVLYVCMYFVRSSFLPPFSYLVVVFIVGCVLMSCFSMCFGIVSLFRQFVRSVFL